MNSVDNLSVSLISKAEIARSLGVSRECVRLRVRELCNDPESKCPFTFEQWKRRKNVIQSWFNFLKENI